MNPRALVVDDSLTVRMNLADMLRADGIDTEICASVAEARRALAAGGFDLAILDVLLPDGDGVELLRELRERPETASCAVMLLSTEAEVRDRIRGLATGADEYVGKPYDPGYVLARARQLMRRGRMPAATDRDVILVIDDSITFRERMKQVLESENFAVLVAANGGEGLRLAADARPAAILIDGVLPDIDGAGVIRRIRLDAALRRTPCVMLTASDEAGAEIRALDTGADAFVRKDEDGGVMLARLKAVLRAAEAQGEDGTASIMAPKKVLAVDDSETYLRALSGNLVQEGFGVALARSGEEALDLLAVQPVDCILLDLMMPGIGGTETCRRIKAASGLRDIPVVMLTALEDRAAMIEGLAAGADDYIAKSSDFAVLRARVAAQIRRKRAGRDEIRRERIDLSAIARSVAAELARVAPERTVRVEIADGIDAECDGRLLRIVLENLLGNAWKYSRDVADARIEFGAAEHDKLIAYFVGDNGAGFDMSFAHKLFAPFERLHTAEQFPGSGIGLATVERIISRHGGRVWAESTVGAGATFFWTLGKQSPESPVS